MSKIVLLAGSNRPDSQSAKIAHFLAARLTQLEPSVSTAIIDLKATPLPLWPASEAEHWPAQAQLLAEADGLVVISPEWHGMACPALKNFFLYATQNELGHKPALLTAISSGIGGAYPISELRASSYKNCRLCYIPEHLIIRQVDKVMNAPEAQNSDDQRIRDRADYALKLLLAYSLALKPIRAQLDQSLYPTGM